MLNHKFYNFYATNHTTKILIHKNLILHPPFQHFYSNVTLSTCHLSLSSTDHYQLVTTIQYLIFQRIIQNLIVQQSHVLMHRDKTKGRSQFCVDCPFTFLHHSSRELPPTSKSRQLAGGFINFFLVASAKKFFITLSYHPHQYQLLLLSLFLIIIMFY